MLERIIGIMKLDVPTYEAVEHDEAATSQAAMIVAVVAVLAAIGAYLGAGAVSSALESLGGIEGMEDLNLPGIGGALSPIGLAIQALISTFLTWIIWSGTTYFIGTRVFGGDATFGEMLRVIGFAQAPRMLALIPCIGFIGGIWALVCGFIAVRQGLDLDNMKSALTIVLSWVVAVVIGIVLGPIYALLSF